MSRPARRDRSDRALAGPVLVVGAGLLGTSIGLALRRRGVEVRCATSTRRTSGPPRASAPGRRRRPRDRPGSSSWSPCRRTTWGPRSPTRCAGTGRRRHRRRQRQGRAARRGRGARSRPRTWRRYVGSHPMAGSERSGPLAASAALFDGRPWAVTPHATVVDPAAVAAGRPRWPGLRGHAGDVHPRGARPGRGPDLAPAAPAGRARRRPRSTDAPADAPGPVRAGGPRRHPDRRRRPRAVAADHRPPTPTALTALLHEVRDDLDGAARRALRRGRAAGGRRAARARGVAGTAVIPGKHGGPPVRADRCLRRRPGPPRRAGAAVRRRRRDRGQHRGRAHRPRPGPAGRPGRADRRRGPRRTTCSAALEDRGWTAHG